MPSLVTVHHLSLSVSDLARSTAWYRDVLGFSVEAEFEGAGFRRTRLRHPTGSITLTLTCHERRSGDAFSELRTGLDHVAFAVGEAHEIDAWKQRFEELGVQHAEVGVRPRGGRAIALRDPDNIQLEVFASRR